ncbi:hypothetical protein AMECASPLE_016125 [Ameca splendens]|uniref:Uncharacterized protein n=1 Tax=Ameca splendens TaxID=208324 RepID=A0ABV1AAN8_9TELE
MNSRRRPAGGVKSVQGDPSPSGTTKKRVSREEEINQLRSSRRAEEIRSHQKQRHQQHGGKRRSAATSADQSVDDGTKQNTHTATSRNIVHFDYICYCIHFYPIIPMGFGMSFFV